MSIIEILLIGAGLSMDAFAVSIAKGLGMPKINWRHALIIALFFGVFQALMPAIGFFVGSLFASYVQAVDHWIAFILLAIIGGKMLIDAFRDDDGSNEHMNKDDDGSDEQMNKYNGEHHAGVSSYNDEHRNDNERQHNSEHSVDVHSNNGEHLAAEGPHSSKNKLPKAQKDKLNIKELFMLAIATSIDALAVGVSFAFLDVNLVLSVSLIGVTTFVFSFIGVGIGNFFGSRWEKGATILGGLVLIFIGAKILLEGLGILA